jgi:multiple sugar transport system ATP-binding protein
VATVRDRLSLQAGDTVRMMPDLTKLHLFDAKTEKRLPIG